MHFNLSWPLLFLFICVTSFSAISQPRNSNSKTDSLQRILKSRQGADRISAQLELAGQIMSTDIKESQNLLRSALAEARKINDRKQELIAFFMLGKASQLTQKRNISEAFFDTALTLAKTLGDNWHVGEILFRKGVIKHNRGEDVQALECFNSSLQACRLSNNFKIMASSYSMMGAIFRVNGLYDRAIEYVVNSKLNYEKAGFTEGYAWDAYLLGRIYSDLKLHSKALDYYQEALGIYARQAKIDKDDNGVAICYEQIGMLYFDSGNFNEASKYIDSTKQVYTRLRSEYGLSNSHKNLGMIEYSTGHFDKAEKYLNESLVVKV